MFSIFRNNIDNPIPSRKILITVVTLAAFWLLNTYPWFFFKQFALHTEGWFRIAAMAVFRYGPWLALPILVAIPFFGVRGSFGALGLNRSALTGLAVGFAGTVVMLLGFAASMPVASAEDWLISAFKFAFLPGIFEEIFYRAFLFGLLFRFAGWGFLPAAVIGAVFFGAGHMYQSGELLEAMGIFAITAFGAVWFSWLYVEWDYNVWVPISFHTFMNFYWGLFDVSETALGSWLANGLRIAVVAISILLTLLISRRNTPRTVAGTVWWRHPSGCKFPRSRRGQI